MRANRVCNRSDSHVRLCTKAFFFEFFYSRIDVQAGLLLTQCHLTEAATCSTTVTGAACMLTGTLTGTAALAQSNIVQPDRCHIGGLGKCAENHVGRLDFDPMFLDVLEHTPTQTTAS
jgi:hypothetical protein